MTNELNTTTALPEAENKTETLVEGNDKLKDSKSERRKNFHKFFAEVGFGRDLK